MFSQPVNVSFSKYKELVGKVMVSRLVQFSKAYLNIFATPLPNVTDLSDVQSENVYCPISVTVFGTLTEVIAVFPLNASLSIRSMVYSLPSSATIFSGITISPL